MKKMSIVIPVFNKWNFTKSCLKDLSHLPNDHEIVVIDNGSTDETISLKSSEEVNYIRQGKNLGFAAACNLGYMYSEGDNVLFLNNDIRVKSDHSTWTQALLEKCETAIVGPTMGQLDSDLNFVQEANKVLPGKSYMSGWCVASSRNVWDKLDFIRPGEEVESEYPIAHIPQIFSEEFGIAYFEDTDLSFRARKLGINFEVVSVPVVHFGKQTSRQLNTYQLYKNARKIFVKKWSKC